MKTTLPVIPATCGACDHFQRWNDGYCSLDEHVCAERTEAPPSNCPLRHACRDMRTAAERGAGMSEREESASEARPVRGTGLVPPATSAQERAERAAGS